MKNRIMIILLSFSVSIISIISKADICPYAVQFTPQIPPAGWTLLIPAIFPGNKYRFVSATHSLNKTYYNLQVLCRYECAPNETTCSPFTILSNATYKWPVTNKAPWNTPPIWVNTLICMPPDNNPLQCVFSNIPNDTLAWMKNKLSWRQKLA